MTPFSSYRIDIILDLDNAGYKSEVTTKEGGLRPKMWEFRIIFTIKEASNTQSMAKATGRCNHLLFILQILTL